MLFIKTSKNVSAEDTSDKDKNLNSSGGFFSGTSNESNATNCRSLVINSHQLGDYYSTALLPDASLVAI